MGDVWLPFQNTPQSFPAALETPALDCEVHLSLVYAQGCTEDCSSCFRHKHDASVAAEVTEELDMSLSFTLADIVAQKETLAAYYRRGRLVINNKIIRGNAFAPFRAQFLINRNLVEQHTWSLSAPRLTKRHAAVHHSLVSGILTCEATDPEAVPSEVREYA